MQDGQVILPAGQSISSLWSGVLVEKRVDEQQLGLATGKDHAWIIGA